MANALLYYLIVINILTFAFYGIDKWKAINVSNIGQSRFQVT